MKEATKMLVFCIIVGVVGIPLLISLAAFLTEFWLNFLYHLFGVKP